MSLEQAISDHASALRELAAAIRATVGAGVADVATAAAAHQVIADAKKPAGTKLEATPTKGEVKQEEVKKPAATQTAATTAKSAPATESPSEAPTYDDVKAKVLALSKEKGREPTVQLLQRHGVAKAPDLKPEQYADFIKDADAIIAGTYDPEAAETV